MVAVGEARLKHTTVIVTSGVLILLDRGAVGRGEVG